MIILDTNVLSEVMRPQPSAAVLRWLEGQRSLELFITTISQAEILYGIELLPKGKRRNALRAQAESMFEEDFGDRILPFDSDAAHASALIAAERRDIGSPISDFDAEIASIARSRTAAVATRDTNDFANCGI